IDSATARSVLCVGAEAQSKGLDLSPASAELSMLFGDGAGALVLDGRPIAIGEARGVGIGIEDGLIETDSSFAEALMVRAPGPHSGPWWSDAAEPRLQYGAMLGRNVILHAVRKMSDAALRLIEGNGIAVADIAAVIPHQANLNLLRAVGKRLGIPEE